MPLYLLLHQYSIDWDGRGEIWSNKWSGRPAVKLPADDQCSHLIAHPLLTLPRPVPSGARVPVQDCLSAQCGHPP